MKRAGFEDKNFGLKTVGRFFCYKTAKGIS